MKKYNTQHYAPPARNLAEAMGNPLRLLTATNLAYLLEAAMRGEWTQLQWLMMHAEQRDADLMALISYRTGAVLEMDWRIKISEKAEALNMLPLAEQQRDALLARYERLSNLSAVIRHLAMATFRGYSHVVIRDGALEPLEQLWFVRDGMWGAWHWNPEARYVSARHFSSPPIDPQDFLIREVPHSLIHLAATKYSYSVYGQRWWATYADAVSKQGVVIIAPPDVPESQQGAFIHSAEQIAHGASGVLPHAASVIQPNAQRGSNVFEPWLRHLSEQLILAGTGGKLKMLNDATGIGSGQSDAHADTFRTIARAEAQEISEVFQRQFDAPVLAESFTDAPVLAYFELAYREQVDTTAYINDITRLAAAGYIVDAEEVSQRTGLQVTRTETVQQTPFAFSAASAAGTLANRSADALGVDAAWLEPVRELLAEIAHRVSDGALTDAELSAYLSECAQRVPELFGRMDVDAFTDVLQSAMADGAGKGIIAALARRKKGG